MDCTPKQNDFKNSLLEIQEKLKGEIAEIVSTTKIKIEKVSAKADKEGILGPVSTTAGTVIGTIVGGPEGGVAGGAIGDAIGDLLTKFFIVEATTNRVELKIDLPEVTLVNQEWLFDLPSVTVKDSDIIFNLPAIRMDRVKSGEYPEFKCEGFPPSCTITWTPIWIDVPVPILEEHRIVIGIPEFYMNEQKFIVGVPEIRMVTQSISFDLPSITIKTRKDIGKEISDEALEIANETKILISQKQQQLKDRIKLEIIPKAVSMLNCFRDSLTEKRQEIYSAFDPAINQVTDVIKNLKANGIPETDDDYINVNNNLNDLLAKRQVAVSSIEKALSDLEESSKTTLDSLTNA